MDLEYQIDSKSLVKLPKNQYEKSIENRCAEKWSQERPGEENCFSDSDLPGPSGTPGKGREGVNTFPEGRREVGKW